MCTVTQHPGKFEGETCITHLAHDLAMQGFGDYDVGEEGDPPVALFYGPFTLAEIRDTEILLCDECLADVLQASRIEFWEDSQGFAYSAID